MSSAAKLLEQLPTAKARTANGASQTAGSWASTLDQADPGSSSRATGYSFFRDVKTLIQWLSHDVLSLAGPPLADRQELFDSLLPNLNFEKLRGVSIHPLRASLFQQRDDLLC